MSSGSLGPFKDSKKTDNYRNDKGSDKDKVRAHVIVTGKVQGVYFRQNTKTVACENNVRGWVQNLSNGSVEAILEGDAADVKEVINWCHSGPPKAVVDDVTIKYEKYRGEFEDFEINY
jgi:acylphosphatase